MACHCHRHRGIIVLLFTTIWSYIFHFSWKYVSHAFTSWDFIFYLFTYINANRSFNVPSAFLCDQVFFLSSLFSFNKKLSSHSYLSHIYFYCQWIHTMTKKRRRKKSTRNHIKLIKTDSNYFTFFCVRVLNVKWEKN